MALTQTNFPAPWPTQKTDLLFGAVALWRHLDHIVAPGVVAAGDLAVTEKAGGANLSVDVDEGAAYVRIASPYGGVRMIVNDAKVNSGAPGSPGTDWLSTFLAPDATNPRIDRVVLRVRDSSIDSGGAYDARLDVVAGTPTAGATLSNLTGAAAVPNGALLLANVLVTANATTITDAEIDTAVRTRAVVGGGQAPDAGDLLDHEEITSPVTVSATDEATPTEVIVCDTVTVDGATPIRVEFYSPEVETGTTAGSEVTVNLWDGTTDLGRLARVGVGDGTRAAKDAVLAAREFTPAAGTHTYKAQAWRATANGTIQAGAGTAAAWGPAFMRVTRRS